MATSTERLKKPKKSKERLIMSLFYARNVKKIRQRLNPMNCSVFSFCDECLRDIVSIDGTREDLLLLFNEIELSLGGSSPHNRYRQKK